MDLTLFEATPFPCHLKQHLRLSNPRKYGSDILKPRSACTHMWHLPLSLSGATISTHTANVHADFEDQCHTGRNDWIRSPLCGQVSGSRVRGWMLICIYFQVCREHGIWAASSWQLGCLLNMLGLICLVYSHLLYCCTNMKIRQISHQARSNWSDRQCCCRAPLGNPLL